MEILDELENTLTNFEPPPNLSPRALRGKYESIITVAKERLAKAEEDIPPPPNQLALRKKEPILPRAPVPDKQSPVDRVNEIVSYIHVPSLSFVDFCTNVRKTRFPQYERREQEFLIRMVRGYEVVSVQEIKDALPQEIRPSSHIWTAACENLTMARQNKDVKERLTLVDCQLLNLAKSAAFTRLIDYALYTAANLQCAIDYNALSHRKRKEYTDALFEISQQTEMEDLGDDETAIKALRRSFTDTHRKTVTGRNHLLTLYKIFGVSILLDPSVEMRTKTGTPTFSKTFPGTLEILEASLQPFSGRLSRRDDKNRGFLVNFLRAVGTKPVYTFIKKFVESLDDMMEPEE